MSNRPDWLRGPSWLVYAFAAACAAPAGGLLPSIWQSGSTFLSGTLAVGAAIFGVFMHENVGEAIVFGVVLGGMFALVPKTFIVTNIGLPLGAGLIIGKFAVGVWKELRD